jgi:SAM-dependent methyltransferase
MSGYDPAAYGDAWAEIYDRVHQSPELDATVSLLADLAAGGRVLEFGAGTGRLVLPLRERGLEVHGIEASEAMLARMRTKPGGADLPLTLGDFTTVRVEGSFSLVVLAFHALFNLPTQQAQVGCFRNAAAHLVAGGRFVVEASVPKLVMFEGAETVAFDGDGVAGDARPALQRHDPVQQRMESVYLYVGAGDPVLLPITIRYAWPSEIDLMARLAGLELEARWADWRQAPFIAASARHISVYRRTSHTTR